MLHLTGGPEEAAEQLIRHLEQQGKLPSEFPNNAHARFDEMRKCQSGHHWVYVLRLRGDKIAVGSTGNLTQRIADHFCGQGAILSNKKGGRKMYQQMLPESCQMGATRAPRE